MAKVDVPEELISIRVLGGPTVVIDYGGLRFLTDPTFDEPQSYPGNFEKTAPPKAQPAELGKVDAVLLSHDEHVDNLDLTGRAFLPQAAVTYTTVSGADRLGSHTKGLLPWESVTLARPAGGFVTVTGAPALHGPEGAAAVVGDVIGFVLSGDGLPTIYISGDNASLDVVREIAARVAPIDTAVLFAGAVRRTILDGALLTLDGVGAAEAASILGARRVVLAHVDSWAHFTEGTSDTVDAFAAAGLSDRLQVQ